MLFASRLARAVRCCLAILSSVSLIGPPAIAQAPAANLQITILDGEDAMNNIRQRTAREPIVQVEDENHKPVAGAAVVFLLPNDGASGTFPGGARTLTTVTDSKGQAVARGLRPNRISGRFQIRVQASYQGKTGQATIDQTNLAAVGAITAATIPKWLVFVAVGAVTATAIVVPSHIGGGSSGSTSVPIAVTPGTGTVGAPR